METEVATYEDLMTSMRATVCCSTKPQIAHKTEPNKTYPSQSIVPSSLMPNPRPLKC